MSMFKTNSKVTLKTTKEKSLDPIPENATRKSTTKTNFLIIRRLNFNFVKEEDKSKKAESKDKLRNKLVTSTNVSPEAKKQSKEKNKSLLTSIRENKFLNKSKIVLSGSVLKVAKKSSFSQSSQRVVNLKTVSKGNQNEENIDKIEIKENNNNNEFLDNVEDKNNEDNKLKKERTDIKDTKDFQNSKSSKEYKKNKESKSNKNNVDDKENKLKKENTQSNKEIKHLYIKKSRKDLLLPVINSNSTNTSTTKVKTVQKIKFESYYNSNKEKDEFMDRYNSVRESSFKDKKLHIFNKGEKLYYYVIHPGNSSYLIKNCMSHRSNWRECQSNVTTLFNFKWQQNTIGLDFASLSRISTIKQIVNHFEYHPGISNKCNLFINLVKYCESKGLEVFKYIPFTILIQYDNASYSSQIENFTSLFNNISEYTMDCDGIIKQREAISNNEPVANFASQIKIKKYSSLFCFNNSGEKLGNRTTAMIHNTHYDGKNYWIVKACDLNRGRCIKLADSLQKIQKLVKKFYEGISKEYMNENEELLRENISPEEEKKKMLTNKYRTNSVIVQKYIEKPLLYRGRKFDIRIWVMMTQNSQVYVFKEGHLKTSSVAYDINLTNSYVHITNYSIQKYNNNFSKFEYGNEVSFIDFQNFLNEEYSSKEINVQNDLVAKMKDIIEISFRSVGNKINANQRKNCFEIFGYDFIMDEDFNVFLLEVNTNPGLEESSPLIKMLVPRMLDDALRLTIDDLYETKYSFFNKEPVDKSSIYCSPFYVEGYADSDNLWETVCDLNEKDTRDNNFYSSKNKRKDKSIKKNNK